MKPGGKCFVEQALRLSLRQHAKERIDLGFDRPLAKQVRAESMNRADVRFLEILNGRVESLLDVGRCRIPPLLFEMLPQAQLQLTCRLLGERDSDNLANISPAFGKNADDPFYQRRRLAGPRRGLDNQRLVDGLFDRFSRESV